MNTVKQFLEKWGLYAFLLPIFFIVHNYRQYYGLVSVSVAVRLGIIILLIFCLFFILVLAVTKHLNKSLQLVTLFGFIALFFGLVKDFLQFSLHAYILSKYSVLLPILIIATILLSRSIIKKKNFSRSNLFQNTLLLVFLAIDISQLVIFSNSSVLQKNLLVKNRFLQLKTAAIKKNPPDVYYLVFDSYPGTSFLTDYMNFDNSRFNQLLEEKGFFVAKHPKSNYNRTAFSIASTLNFAYLKNIKPYGHVSPKNYAEANLTVKQALAPRFFQHQKYSLYNLSVFDIGTSTAIHKETFLTLPEENILLYNTLPERIKNDVLWHFVTGKYAISFVQDFFTVSKEKFQKQQGEKNIFNRTVLDSLLKVPFIKTVSPKFVYAHFYLPHPPFFYDENGKQNDVNYITTEASLKNKDLFLSYLKYTNKIIEKIINTINAGSFNKSIIIIQSDHGFRDYIGGPNDPGCFFMNYSAFYFPDHDYSALYDTLSNINTFPIIFNKYFNTTIPLQKDSSIFLAD